MEFDDLQYTVTVKFGEGNSLKWIDAKIDFASSSMDVDWETHRRGEKLKNLKENNRNREY